MINYSFFIPCYNEESVLKRNVLLVLKKLQGFKSWELILVNDGSTDGTKAICDELAKNSRVKCFHYDSPSRRENLLKSFSKSKGRVIVYFDADLSTDLSGLSELIDLKDHDLAIGSRYLPGSVIDRHFDRLIISYLFNGLMKLFFRSKLSDHYIGFKSFKREVVFDLLKHSGVGVPGRGMFVDAELMMWAQKLGYKIKSFPVKWVEGRKSAIGWFKDWGMLWYIVKFFFRFHSKHLK